MKSLFSFLAILAGCLHANLHALDKSNFNTITPGVLRIGSSFSNPPFTNHQKGGLEVEMIKKRKGLDNS